MRSGLGICLDNGLMAGSAVLLRVLFCMIAGDLMTGPLSVGETVSGSVMRMSKAATNFVRCDTSGVAVCS
jgi:hypothetical protein